MIVVHVLILWGLVVLALGIAYVAQRRGKKGGDKPEYAVALGFVASSYGLLLGLLVSFGASHYTDVRHQAQEEADALIALWDTVAVYQPQVRDPTRRALFCYMRAIRDNDWPSMERGVRIQSHHATAYGDRLRTAVLRLPEKRPGETSAYGRAQGIVIDADKSRQQLLFATESNVPTVLAGGHLRRRVPPLPPDCDALRGSTSRASRLVGRRGDACTVVVAVLTALDQPYGAGARVNPTSLRHAITLLNPHRETTGIYAPCTTARDLGSASVEGGRCQKTADEGPVRQRPKGPSRPRRGAWRRGSRARGARAVPRGPRCAPPW